MIIKAIATEKAIKAMELENKLWFVVDSRADKNSIKKEIESQFKVKVQKINTHFLKGAKIAIITLKKETPAIDVATKLGLI